MKTVIDIDITIEMLRKILKIHGIELYSSSKIVDEFKHNLIKNIAKKEEF